MKHIGKLITTAILFCLIFSCRHKADPSAKLHRFRAYFSAVGEYSTNKWDYAADTVRLWFDEKAGEPVLQVKGKVSTGRWKDWDEEMNTATGFDSIWYVEEENAVKGYFYENNDFYRLIGKNPNKTLRTYWFNENDKIHEILIYWIPEEAQAVASTWNPLWNGQIEPTPRR